HRRDVGTRHLNSKCCLHLILGRKTFDHRERSVDTGLGNPAARKLSGSLKLKQRSVEKITGASPQSFFQPTPPDLPLTIGRVELRNGGSDPAKRLPLLVRAKIIEYAEERAAGTYG